jgi:FtsP/CotA-like multicopper oxidase with cupredoxin domain
MTFPPVQQWPPLPSFLADIQPSEIVKRPPPMVFSMTGQPGQGPSFFINNKQFDPSCADLTMQLGTAEEWVVANSSKPNHPFHIHTNPFQIVKVGTQDLPRPWVWWDTFALPSVSNGTNGSITIRHRFMDFTGEYVLHCHFLGHEDRGMMLATQTVCPPTPVLPPRLFFGKARVGQPECVPGNLIAAAPQCAGSQ